jgi:hypothetical protein
LGGPRVQRVYARAGKFVLACLILFSFAAIASLGTSLGTTFSSSLSGGPLRFAEWTPAEIVAARFPSADASLPMVPALSATATVLPMERWGLFSPDLSYPSVTASAAPSAGESQAEQPAADQAKPAATQATAAKAESPKVQAANAAPRRVASRASGVLNDAQIANIKRRLNLTPDQEQMWPAVETALRKIVYTKNATEQAVRAAQSSGSHMAYVDPSSAEVQQLKYAALPLIMRLNDDQRREVKMMAHVMGLEGVASQF